MERKEYIVGWNNAEKSEKVLRDFLSDVVSHEPEVTLYLTIAEKEHLQRIGVVFGYPR